jgi:hypothetical protein
MFFKENTSFAFSPYWRENAQIADFGGALVNTMSDGQE